MNILFVNACLRGENDSRSYEIASTFMKELKKNTDNICSQVNLAITEVLPLRIEDIKKRDKAAEIGDFSDVFFDLAKQFAAADLIVIAAPLWDLSFPAVLKAYFEHICVCGITFCYTEHGSKGLCRAEKVAYITSRGGDFTIPEFSWMEQAVPYVKALSFMLGIPEVEVISADGLDIIGNDTKAIVEGAKEKAKAAAFAFLQ